MYRLSPGTALLFIDAQPLLFTEQRQKLFALDRLTGYIACRLEEGVRGGGLLRDLIDRGIAENEVPDLLERLLCEWSRHGLVAVEFAPDPAPPVTEQSVRLAGYGAQLRYFDPHLAELVAPLFAHVADLPHPPVTTYDIRRSERLVVITRAGKSSAVVPAQGAAPALKAQLTEDVLAAAGDRLALHAACLVRNGRALLLSGPPGDGKTTLALWLASSGFAIASDDMTLLDRSGRVEGVAFPAAAKPGAWKIIAKVRPDLVGTAVHVRADGKRVRYLAPEQPAPLGPLPVGGIAVLKRRAGAAPRALALEPTTVVARLVDGAATSSSSLSASMLRSLAAVVQQATCIELEYDAPAGAVELLTRLFDHAGP